ncbi:MAG: PEP-CTERM motif protein [Planctomycetes bacterium ADurb.Bin126]|nr:MAG: PEP-CTERM motif protein [Planctomycetes bacterium ADurb.Bin126]HOD82834.1 PEP-CTERM sorting domain-containing protein [Phycisphaerae bacterium]HQL74647.1 PEP-CTERM sorting domain-containing protein [Phycisphaerae bacterium]
MTRRQLSALAVVTAAFLLSAGPARAGLVAWWSFDEGTGAVAGDAAGGHAATLQNMEAADWVAGHTGGAGDYSLSFDGTDDYVQAIGYKGVAGRAARTISAWINSSATNDDIVSYGTNTGSQKWVFRTNSTNGLAETLRVEVNGGYQVGSTDIVGTGWTHVVAVWENDGTPNAEDLKLYVNGVLEINSATGAYSINTNSGQDVWIGGESFDTSRNFAGQIDDVAIWNRALTAAEIAQLAGGALPTAIATVAPKPVLNYDAAQDPTPTDGLWNDLGGFSTSHDWAINNNAGGARLVDAASDPIYTPGKAYTFNGTTDTATTAEFEAVPGNPSDDSASFEILFKPSDLVGQEILFETGGTGNGTGLAIDGNKVLFVPSSGSAATTKLLSYEGLTGDYVHVVGVLEKAGTALGNGVLAYLYVDNVLVDSVEIPNFADWCGTDDSGLGQVNGAAGGNNTGWLSGFGNFSGEIAVMRFYDTALTAGDVGLLNQALVPEPATMALLGLASCGLGGYIRRRRAA